MSKRTLSHRRALQIGGVSSNGILRCKIRSFTDGPVYEIGVRLEDGRVCCTCPDFEYRHGLYAPTLGHGHTCKHLDEFRATLQHEQSARLEHA